MTSEVGSSKAGELDEAIFPDNYWNICVLVPHEISELFSIKPPIKI